MVQLWEKKALAAYGYSLARLCLNYYAYVDGFAKAGKTSLDAAKELEFCQLLDGFLKESPIREKLQNLRSQIIASMQQTTALADCFAIYEYGLNRMERRFCPDQLEISLSEESFVNHLLLYVSEGQDGAHMNLRIQQVVAQLPIRYTRQKFYTIVQDALSIYAGSDTSALSDLLFQIRMAATVGGGDLSVKESPVIGKYLEDLKTLPWKTMTKESYETGITWIALAGEALSLRSDRLSLLEDLVNDLYVLELTKEPIFRDVKQEQDARAILTGLLACHQKSDQMEIPDLVTQELFHLEGMQERCFEQYQKLEQEENPSESSRIVDLLLSTSPFASLDRPTEPSVLSQQDVNREAQNFFAELDPVFDAAPKVITRAIMATVLSNLPFCFHSLSELEQYVRSSLQACEDPMEKETCKELLVQLMETEGYALV